MVMIVACADDGAATIEAVTTSTSGAESGATTTGTTSSPLDSSGPVALDMASEDPWPNLPAPNCEELSLPGDPVDVGMTPRADRGAELLALRASNGAIVARQDDYDVIEGDLAAIRELAPELASIDIGCEAPTTYQFHANGTYDDFALVDAVWQWTFHAWDCHNAFYGIEHRPAGQGGDVARLDGIVFLVRVFGLYDPPQFIDVYSGVAGFEGMDITESWYYGDGTHKCEPDAGTITLVVAGESAAVGARTYTYVDPVLGERVFTAAPGETPVEA